MICEIIAIVVIIFIALIALFDKLRHTPFVDDIQDKYVLVTGCDTGFGRLLALELDQNWGCNVIAACLTEKGEENIKNEASDRLTAVRLDVSSSESIKKAYDIVSKQLPNGAGLWAVVNNAGLIGPSGPCEFHTRQDYINVLQVNLLGMIETATTFLPLIKQSRGRIINTSSIAGRLAQSMLPAYTISKTGVQAFSDVLRRNMRSFNVDVSIIEPGSFGTGICNVEHTRKSWWSLWNRQPEHIQNDYGNKYIAQHIERAIDFATNRMDPDISKVTNVYTHAIFAQHPRKRYAPGRRAAYYSIPLSYAPSCISDRVMEYGMPQPALGSVSDKKTE